MTLFLSTWIIYIDCTLLYWIQLIANYVLESNTNTIRVRNVQSCFVMALNSVFFSQFKWYYYHFVFLVAGRGITYRPTGNFQHRFDTSVCGWSCYEKYCFHSTGLLAVEAKSLWSLGDCPGCGLDLHQCYSQSKWNKVIHKHRLEQTGKSSVRGIQNRWVTVYESIASMYYHIHCQNQYKSIY